MSRITPEVIARAQAALQNDKMSSLTPLQCHVAAFGSLEADGSITFSTDSIAKAVSGAGESSPSLVGFAVHLFNAVHEGQCPFGNTTFSTPKQTDFGPSLHLGTLRFYNKDGSFNEDNWNAFVESLGSENQFVSQTQLLNYLDTKKDLPEEAGTNRHDDTNNPLNNKSMQMAAGSEAWKEALKLFAYTWYESTTDNLLNPIEYLAIVETELLKLFFTNTPLALQAAKELGLPVKKPSVPLKEAILADEVNIIEGALEAEIDLIQGKESVRTSPTGSGTFRLPQQEANAQATTSYWKACAMM